MIMFASLFTGFGLADVGALTAGCELGWGVEIDPAIAEVGQYNLKHPVTVASVLDCDPHKFEKPDILWASPSCINFSAAKANRAETDLDCALAQKIVDFLKVLQPQTFILENVEAYKRSNSLEFIEGALYSLGYWIDRQIVNFADYGVPQTRKRLILRAVRGAMVPGLPQKQAWKGWYQSVEDIIDTLPETQLAQWQLDRLPEPLVSCLFQAGNPNGNRIEKFRRTDYPSPTVCTSEGLTRAVLIDGTEQRNFACGLRKDDKPVSAVKTTEHQEFDRAILLDVGNTIRDCITRNQDEPSITIIVDKMRRPASTPKALLIPGSNVSSFATRYDDEPANTIGDTNRVGNIARAFLVDGIANSNGRTVTIVDRDCPSYTVKASAGKQASRAWLEQGESCE